MPIRLTQQKSYPIAVNREDPGTSSLPTVSLTVEKYENNLDKFNLIIIVLNASSAVLSKQFFTTKNGDEEPVGEPELFDVQTVKFKSFEVDRVYKTRFILTASNSIGTVSTEPITIDPSSSTITDLPTSVIESFSIKREPKTYDLINAQLVLAPTEEFNISALSGLELFYKRKDAEDWKTIILSKNKYLTRKDSKGKISGYIFNFNKQSIIRSDSGGYFDFYIKVSFDRFTPQNTEQKTLFFDNVDNTEPQRPIDSSISTNIIDVVNPATLRYEIYTKFSEVYTISNNRTESIQGDEITSAEPTYSHGFLDTSVFKGLDIGNYYFTNGVGNDFFYYEPNYTKTNNETKGYFYPASVTEIHPCIITNKEGLANKSVVLFWKINDDFFDYSFFENKISIKTTLFQVKLQYKSGASYVDLTKAITITKDPTATSAAENKKFGFFTKSQKFVLSIERDVDVIAAQRSLFDRIDELEDNKNDNLRLLVVKHEVECTSSGRTKSLSFSKLLIPPYWRYIAYDKYVPLNAETRSEKDKKINLDLNSPVLRGIRIPEAGFYKYDELKGITTSDGRSSSSTFDFKIFYKLACEYDVFYRDPVLEGTVNSILLPSVPKDVFLIPPTLKIPPPNLVPESQGGKRAEGIVKLNEYGKIVGIQITDPGHGYSLFKNLQSKREQTFTDLVPFVKRSFQIVANDLNINRSVLVLQNNSFDRDNLKASIEGGVRLASVYSDKQRLEQNNGNPFSVEQKARLDEYLNFSIPEEQPNSENSVAFYDLDATPEEKDVSSIGILDETWNIISKLYTDKFTNPLENSQIYTEDTDAGVSEVEDSTISSTIEPTKDSSAITPVSLNPNVEQKSADGGIPELFSLNNLTVVPDGSAAVFSTSRFTPPPWLTLLPLSVRGDGQYGFGPLPNMLPRAEMFNRLVMGINNLNEVRVILPMIWAVDQKNSYNAWYESSLGDNEFDLISFNTNGTKQALTNEASLYLPINSSIAVSASRSVGRVELKSDRAEPLGLAQGIYKVSSEDSMTLSFKPFLHPLMAGAFKESYLRTFRRKILGIVTEQTTSCVNNSAPIGVGGYTAIGCRGLNNDSYEKYVPPGTLLPTANTVPNTYFQFYNAGGTIEANARGTAQALSVSNGRINGEAIFCTYGCGDSYSKAIDFTYANMFPGTIKI